MLSERVLCGSEPRAIKRAHAFAIGCATANVIEKNSSCFANNVETALENTSGANLRCKKLRKTRSHDAPPHHRERMRKHDPRTYNTCAALLHTSGAALRQSSSLKADNARKRWAVARTHVDNALLHRLAETRAHARATARLFKLHQPLLTTLCEVSAPRGAHSTLFPAMKCHGLRCMAKIRDTSSQGIMSRERRAGRSLHM